jgi:hypothetical protein
VVDMVGEVVREKAVSGEEEGVQRCLNSCPESRIINPASRQQYSYRLYHSGNMSTSCYLQPHAHWDMTPVAA